MEKKLYYNIQNNADLSMTVKDVNCLKNIMDGDFHDLTQEQIEEYEYTITPVFMTDKEFRNLPEAD